MLLSGAVEHCGAVGSDQALWYRTSPSARSARRWPWSSPGYGQHYAAWVDAVKSCVDQQAPSGRPIVLFGISLGASVALAAGTVLPQVDAVVDWSGSLPDSYFYHLQRLPPLLILHGDEDANVPVINARQLFELCRRVGTVCTGNIYHDGHVFPYHRDDATERTQVFLQSRITLAAKPH